MEVRAVLASPEQVLEVRRNRVVLQSRVNLGSTARLIRVFVGVLRGALGGQVQPEAVQRAALLRDPAGAAGATGRSHSSEGGRPEAGGGSHALPRLCRVDHRGSARRDAADHLPRHQAGRVTFAITDSVDTSGSRDRALGATWQALVSSRCAPYPSVAVPDSPVRMRTPHPRHALSQAHSIDPAHRHCRASSYAPECCRPVA